MSTTIFAVYTWDHEVQRWHKEATVSKWRLRGEIRRLRSEGWTSISVLIERIESLP